MVTGNIDTNYTYKHALINQIKLEQCTLSIRVLPDGLSLFVHQPEEGKLWMAMALIEKSGFSLIESLHNIWKSEPILKTSFKHCSVFVQTERSVWIPESFFEKENIKSIVNGLMFFEEEHQDLLYDFHFKWNAYQVYTLAKDVKEFLNKNIKPTIQYLNDLYFEFNRSKTQLTIQKKVYYSKSGNLIDIWMMKGSKLIFHKSIWDSNNENETEFKILNILKATSFDFVDDIFYVFDQLNSKRFDILFTYIKTIQVLNSLELIKFPSKELKTLPTSVEIKRVLE